ncbi:MAG: HEAT repeat domain-containing protein [Planctomycetaceae bacterium]|nr:HEAT repeat domain-containing protein [Planctomycetaceae bacterium]
MPKNLFMIGNCIVILIAILITFATSSCRSTDFEFLAKTSIIPAYSDKIPGLDSPHERRKLIYEKGVAGADKSTPEKEREILFAQLWQEYCTSPDPNMRREAVDAMAKIPYKQREKCMIDVLKDDNAFIRISAVEALGKIYNSENEKSENEKIADLLINQIKLDTDKDVRIIAIRELGKKIVDPQLNKKVIIALGDSLNDKILAIRYEATSSLNKVSGKDYGKDINRWVKYVQNIKGETTELPKERTWVEKLPTIHLPMLK